MSEAVAVSPLGAATVILVRERGDSPWECFMVRRHVASEFAPDVYVFPGGKLDDGDRDADLGSCTDQSPPGDRVSFPDDDFSFRIAALRELFEEAGVLLAVDEDGTRVRTDTGSAAAFEQSRQRLHAGQLRLVDLARSMDVRFTPGALVPFSRWITPVGMPRRYDTRFYLALLPEGQEPTHDQIETTHGVWISPADALERHARGTFPLVFATIRHLERMSHFSTVAALLDGVVPSDLQPIIPRIIERGGTRVFLLPRDAGYCAE